MVLVRKIDTHIGNLGSHSTRKKKKKQSLYLYLFESFNASCYEKRMRFRSVNSKKNVSYRIFECFFFVVDLID